MKRRSKKRKKRKNPLLSLGSMVVMLPPALALLFSYLSIFINPANFTLPLFFGLYFLPLFLLNLFLLVVGLFLRSRWAKVTFVSLLPSLLFVKLFFSLGPREELVVEDKAAQYKLLSYNVGLFVQGKKEMKRHEAKTKIIQFVESEEPDIVAFQEFYLAKGESVAKLFPNYPYNHYHFFKSRGGGRFGNLTLSKYPIRESGKLTFERSTNLSIFSDLELPTGVVRVYNTHLESHAISFTSLIKRIREKRELTDEISKIHGKVAVTFKRRSKQVDIISAKLRENSTPAIICGDLNDTPMSYTYRKLSKGRRDSFKESGRGFSSTYSLLWPLLRIDYILSPEPFVSSGHTTPKVPYSDHYPVMTKLIVQ